MPFNLHPKCRKRLVETLAKGLPRITATNGMFLEPMSYLLGLFEAEEVLPKTGHLRDQLVEYVDDFPLTSFVSEMLATDLRERDKYLSDTPSIKLIELEGYGDTEKVAESLVECFESLPWQYTLSVMLPGSVHQVLSRFVTELPLSDQIRLIRPTRDFVERFPLKSEDEKRQKRIYGGGGILGFGLAPDPEWIEDATYLQTDVEGFIGMYGSTLPASNAKILLRAFCGLAIAIRLFRIEPKYGAFPFGSYKSHFFVHKRRGDGWEIDGKFDLEDRHSTTFNDIVLNDLDGKLDTEEKKVGWAKRGVTKMCTVFSSGEKGNKIIRASQWLFDSYTPQDELLSFVQSIVVLEILLGDEDTSDEIGLGELLRNRCAYLIGESHHERSELLETFKKIYRVRSQIVHSGKSRLTPDERSLFSTLRWMCRRVIQEELSLLEADLKEAKS